MKPQLKPEKPTTSTTSEPISTASTSSEKMPTTTSTTTTSTTTTTTTTIPMASTTNATFLNSTDLKFNLTSTNIGNDSESLSTSAPITLADIAKIQNFSINEIPGQNIESDEEISDDESTTKFPELASIDRIDKIDDAENEEEEEVSSDQVAEGSEKHQEFRPRPEYRPSETKNNGSSMQGQLFQEVAAKEKQKQPVYKGQGM